MFIQGGMESARYVSLLADTLLPFTDAKYKGASRVKQRNAETQHRLFTQGNVTVLDWPVNYSDRNLMVDFPLT